jgi:type II secretory pathway pseudopilin PulG
MVLGIASFVLCLSLFTGIPAIILGHISRSKIKKSMGSLQGDGLALTGLILGYISLVSIPIIAAIAIPNLLRARISANEAQAASTVRVLNTSQITYSTTYPDQGYARDLATLGGNCTSGSGGTAEHACLLDSQLGQANCTSGVWCQKGSYKFTISSNCAPARFGEQQQGTENACAEYVIAATPINFNTGRRSYCSISDAVVRSRLGGPISSPPTAEECQTWDPL